METPKLNRRELFNAVYREITQRYPQLPRAVRRMKARQVAAQIRKDYAAKIIPKTA